MAKALVEIKQLSHVYKQKGKNAIKAVDNLTLDIYEGETLGLVGESGCGKSTTGRAIVKLLNPTSGDILFNGQSIKHLKKKREINQYRQSIQMIFQDPYASLNPKMTILDNVGESLTIFKLVSSRAEKRKKVSQLLQLVGLDDSFMNRYPHEFSGGQRQRIGIARALAVSPKFIVCDEPISALDVSIQAQVVNLLKELQTKEKLTYLFIAHDLSMVKYISHRIGVMYRGKLVELAEADDLYKHPLHPYTQSLLSTIPTADPYSEKKKQRKIYIPEKDTAADKTLRELRPNHFVYCQSSLHN